MTVWQSALFLIYILLQGFLVNYLYDKYDFKLNWKFLITLSISILYLAVNLLVVTTILFFNTIQWWTKFYPFIKVINFFALAMGVILSLISIYLLIKSLKTEKTNHVIEKNNKLQLDKRRFIKRILISSLVLGTTTTYSIYKGKEDIDIIKVQLEFKNLPKSFDGYKIIQISDFHSSYFVREGYLTKVIEKVNQLKGNALALTGDYITGSKDKKYLPELLRSFSKINSSYKKFAILGNHDFNLGENYVAEKLNEVGIDVLRNEHRKISMNGGSIYIAGIDDIWKNHDDIAKAVKNLPQNEHSILLCHNPDFIKTASKYRFDLMLSGHTHGGQVQLPFIGPLVVPSRYGKKFAEGLHRFKGCYLYINRGIGVIAPPIRFLCPPEITEITLVKQR